MTVRSRVVGLGSVRVTWPAVVSWSVWACMMPASCSRAAARLQSSGGKRGLCFIRSQELAEPTGIGLRVPGFCRHVLDCARSDERMHELQVATACRVACMNDPHIGPAIGQEAKHPGGTFGNRYGGIERVHLDAGAVERGEPQAAGEVALGVGDCEPP